MFTKQHYKEIATILKNNDACLNTIRDFILYFQKDNENFDEQKFMDCINGV